MLLVYMRSIFREFIIAQAGSYKSALTTRFTPLALPGDLLGGVTSAIVALPMALTFGMITGLGPAAGVYGAVILGLVTALMGGSKVLISEPTGPMTVMIIAVMASIQERDPTAPAGTIFTVIVFSGLFQIVLGWLKLGKYVTTMPYGVISGFMSGVGVLLVLQQFPALFGLPSGSSLSTAFSLLDTVNPIEASVGIGLFVFLLVYPKRLRTFAPPFLIVLVIGLVVAQIISALLSSYHSIDFYIATVGTFSIHAPQFVSVFPQLSLLPALLIDALLLAILGSIDTLLTASIADNMLRTHHDADRELQGQGLGNMLSGFLGGLPGAGATMGTVVGINSGARTPFAGILRSCIIVLAIIGASPMISAIPKVALAAIAVKVGLDILDWSFIGRAHRISRRMTFLMYLVLGLTVFVNLLVAVGIGIFIANIMTIERLSRSELATVNTISLGGDAVQVTDTERELIQQADGAILVLELSGPMIFGVAQALSRESSVIRDTFKVLVIDLETVPFLDTTIALLLEGVIADALTRQAMVYVCTQHDQVREKLRRLDVFAEDVHLRGTRQDALTEATEILHRNETAPPFAMQS